MFHKEKLKSEITATFPMLSWVGVWPEANIRANDGLDLYEYYTKVFGLGFKYLLLKWSLKLNV